MKPDSTFWLAPWLLLGACGGRDDPQLSGMSAAGTAGAGGGSVSAAGASAAGSEVVVAGWPGESDVRTADAAELFTDNVSGITYESAATASPPVLWAVANIPGLLYRLLPGAGTFASDPAGGWAQGKALRFTDGTGAADAESVTLGASSSDGLYVASEHDNVAASVSRCSILRYDVSAPGASLTATHEWNVTALLPPFAANLGIEAITWVSDTHLLEKGFFDEAAGREYAPADYGEHGAGLFFVGVEQTGQLYGFALDHGAGKATLIASIASPFPGAMSLEHDRETGYLWVGCDDTCANEYAVLNVDTAPGSPTRGRFTLRAIFDRPSALPNSNHEGLALGPESECVAGLKPFYWADDADVQGHTLRRGTIPCGPFL